MEKYGQVSALKRFNSHWKDIFMHKRTENNRMEGIINIRLGIFSKYCRSSEKRIHCELKTSGNAFPGGVS